MTGIVNVNDNVLVSCDLNRVCTGLASAIRSDAAPEWMAA